MGIKSLKSNGGASVSAVKSVQRGSTVTSSSTPVNITISAVNMAKTSVNLLTTYTNYGLTANISLNLTSSTNLQLTNVNGVSPGAIYWEVIEYY